MRAILGRSKDPPLKVMAFRLADGDVVRYQEIMEGVTLGTMLEFLELASLEATLRPKRRKPSPRPSPRGRGRRRRR